MNLKVFLKNLFFITLILNFSTLVFAEDTLEIYSPNYFDEQDNVYDLIHYLENEDLSFKFCSKSNDEISNLNFNIKCANEVIELSVNEFDSKCYFSNFDLEKLQCSEFTLDIVYDSSNKKREITRLFKEETQSNLANFILSKESSSLNPLDLSYYLMVLTDIRTLDSFDVQQAYDLLKNKRNNNFKCWPSNSCSLTQTIEILRNLKFAGFSDETRILEDGKIYLENNIVERAEGTYENFNDIDYEFELKFIHNFSDTGDIDCDLTIDNEDEKTYSYEDGDDREDLFLQDSVDEEIKLDCDDQFDLIELRVFEDKIEEKEYSSDDSFTFELDDSDLDDYDSFDFVLEFNHNFGSSEEIDCDLTTDGDEDSFTLDENSDEDELIIKGDFDDKIELDCDNDLDDIYLDIYANLDSDEEYSNEDEINFEISSSGNNQDSFEFRFDMEYDFDSNEEIECTLKIDDGSTRTYTFDDNDENDLVIDDRTMSSKVNLDCDKEFDKLRFRLYDSFGRAQVDDEKEEIKSYATSVPNDFSEYSCIGTGQTCNYANSIQTLFVYDSSFENSADIEKYTDSLIQDSGETGIFIQDQDSIIDTAKYLVHKDNEDLTEYLKYIQNNEGSWGNDNKVESTSWAVLGLESSDPNSEHLEDGKDWIYYNEPSNGWGSIQLNGLAYNAIKEKIKPYLIINAQNTIYGNTFFEIENPTIYDLQELKITFSPNIEKFISGKVDLGELKADEKLSFNLTVSDDLLGSVSGEMEIVGVNHKKEKLELIKMPIRLIGQMPFTIKEEAYAVSVNELNTVLNIVSNIDSFNLTCDYTNPFSNAKESVSISQNSKQIRILNTLMAQGNFTVNLNCKSDKDSFIVEVPVNVIKVDKSFDIENRDITITSDKDFSLRIENLNTDKQTIQISVEGVYEGVIEPAENSKIFAKNESRDIFFKVTNPEFLSALGNDTQGNLVLTGENGYVERIPLNIDFGGSTDEGGSMMIWYIIIGIVVIIVIAVLLIRRYRQLQEPDEPKTDSHIHDDMMIDDLEFE